MKKYWKSTIDFGQIKVFLFFENSLIVKEVLQLNNQKSTSASKNTKILREFKNLKIKINNDLYDYNQLRKRIFIGYNFEINELLYKHIDINEVWYKIFSQQNLNNILLEKKADDFSNEEIVFVIYTYLISGRNKPNNSSLKYKEIMINYLDIFKGKRSIRSFVEKAGNINFYDENGYRTKNGRPNGYPGFLANKYNFKNWDGFKLLSQNQRNEIAEEGSCGLVSQHNISEYESAYKHILLKNNINFEKSSEINANLRDEYKKSLNVILRNPYFQKKWKDNLFKIYDKGCWLDKCSFNLNNLIVASHVKPFSHCTEEESFELENGVLLCPNHDAMFDRGLISFDDKGNLILNNRVLEISEYIIDKHSSLNIKPISKLRKEFLKYHREIIFVTK